jgi:hypothetical protein
MTIYHQQGAIHINLFHGFVVFESAKVSRFQKILAPFILSANTFWAASTNMFRRVLTRQSAYPGLRALLGRCYDSIENNKLPPVTAENLMATTLVCESFGQKLLAAD